jgi:SAM-dependent methyltransferase
MIDKSLYQEMAEYYKNLYGSFPYNLPFPDADLATRAGKIMATLSPLAKQHYANTDQPFRLIDVGCANGRLTNMLKMYGEVVGIDPVPASIDAARALYPGIEFEACVPQEYLEKPDFKPFDAVVSTEVLEHIPYAEKDNFMRSLSALVKPGGNIIMTTPREELHQLWTEQKIGRPQPVEDWLTEQQLDDLIQRTGLYLVKRDRCYVLSLKRGWLFEALRIRPRVLRRLRLTSWIDWANMIYQFVWIHKPVQDQ